jgi:hypothetical protein
VLGRRLVNVRRAAAMLAVTLVVGLVLAAQPLHAGAADIASPSVRAVALAVTWPFAKVGGLLHIEQGRKAVVAAFTPEEAPPPGPEEGPPGEVPPDRGAPPFLPPETEVALPTTSSTEGSGAGPTAGTAPSTTTTERRPLFDAKHPLHVLVVGDSLVREVAEGMVRVSGDLPMTVEYRYKVSSGLVNTSFFDWPAELRRLVTRYHPDVTIMMYGNNDHLTLRVDGRTAPIFSPEWLTEYGRRVKVATGIPAAAGSRVVWIGMPVMRSDKFSTTARTLNGVFSGVCKSKGYWYVDGYKLFSDKDGHYAPYLPDPSGKPRLVRGADGIHLTAAGGDRVVREVLRVLEKHFRLKT